MLFSSAREAHPFELWQGYQKCLHNRAAVTSDESICYGSSLHPPKANNFSTNKRRWRTEIDSPNLGSHWAATATSDLETKYFHESKASRSGWHTTTVNDLLLIIYCEENFHHPSQQCDAGTGSEHFHHPDDRSALAVLPQLCERSVSPWWYCVGPVQIPTPSRKTQRDEIFWLTGTSAESLCSPQIVIVHPSETSRISAYLIK